MKTIKTQITETTNAIAAHQSRYDELCEELRTSRHYNVEKLSELNNEADNHLFQKEHACERLAGLQRQVNYENAMYKELF